VPIRHAQPDDLAAVVAIYNTSIPGRMATADTESVSVADRHSWFKDFRPDERPLWVYTASPDGQVSGWLGLRNFYGRPAYRATVEVGVYVDPAAQHRGIATSLLAYALTTAPEIGIRTLLGFIFAHNGPSISLFEKAGFAVWGRLPRVAELDGIERDLAILGRRVGR
jgi:L-amino acid N-acyltransferase YncA